MNDIMSLNFTEKEYEVKSYEVNANSELKMNILLHFLEDIAYENAEKLGFGFSQIYPRGFGWFLIKYNIILEKSIKVWNKIKIRTWACENKGIQARRDFEIYNSNGVRIGSIASFWVLIDLNSKRIVNLKKAIEYPIQSSIYAIQSQLSEIQPLTNSMFQKSITANFDDIDLNRHVNNSKYITWAENTLDYDFLIKYRMNEIVINYKHEIKYGEKVICKTQIDKDNNKTIHSFVSENFDTELAIININWVLID
jgi:medium-chain acyl-[acyl-carrier-protein] hydrolase